MKWFLVLVILLMGGGGYFEYQNLQDALTSDQKQIGELKSKLQDETSADQQSADSLAQLKKSLADAQAKSDSLAAQLQAAKAAAPSAATSTTPGLASSSSSLPPAMPGIAPTPASALITKLGTIATVDGKTYSNCQLLKVRSDDIVISDSDGITQVAYNVLPAAMQKLFGYDPKLGTLSDTQVESLEQQREAAAAAGK